MNAEESQEGQEEPGNGVVDRATLEPEIGLAAHAGDQKQIDEPANSKQSQGKEINGSRDGFAEVKAMGTREAEDPEQVANEGGVGGLSR